MISTFDLIINIIEGFLHIFFLSRYFQMNGKYNKIIGIIFSLILAGLITLSNIYSTGSFTDIYFLSYILVLIIFGIIFAKNNFIECIFAGFLVDLITAIINYSTLIIASLIILHDINIPQILNSKYIYPLLAIITKVAFLLAAIYIPKIRNKYLYNLPTNISVVILFNFIFLFLIFIIVNDFLITNKISTISFILLVLMLIIISVIFIFIFLHYLKQNEENNLKQNQIIVLKAKVDHIDEVLHLDKKISTLRHDIQHILNTVLYNMQNNNTDKAIQIIAKYSNDIKHTKIINTSNNILDYILNKYYQKAKQKNINFIYSIDENCHFKITETELSILLGNGLENAIENCYGDTIKINIKFVHDKNVIIIENPINKKKIDLPSITNAEKTDLHGYGIDSMKEIVKKNNGFIKFESDNYLFKLTIIIE